MDDCIKPILMIVSQINVIRINLLYLSRILLKIFIVLIPSLKKDMKTYLHSPINLFIIQTIYH